jgi:peptidoglycan hydrolase CwlO-like protein
MPKDHLDLTGRLNNLKNILNRQYKCIRNIKDLKKAIRAAQQTVNIILKDYLDLARRLNNLRTKLGHRYKRTGKMEDLKEAIHITQQA